MTLEGQNRQSPIASVQRTRSTLASHSAVPRGTNAKQMNANRAIRIAAITLASDSAITIARFRPSKGPTMPRPESMGHSATSSWGPHLCHGSSINGWGHVQWIIIWAGAYFAPGSFFVGSQTWGHPCDSGVTHLEKGCKCSKLYISLTGGFCGSPGRVLTRGEALMVDVPFSDCLPQMDSITLSPKCL